MRVGFIADPLIVIRPDGTVYKHPPLALLDVPHAWRASPPDAGMDVYAGVVDLDAIQTQNLLDRAQAAGIRLALVVDVDKASGTQPLSAAENLRLTVWMAEKGLPGPGVLEAQIDYVQRIQKLLNPSHSMDRVLSDVDAEVTALAAVRSQALSA